MAALLGMFLARLFLEGIEHLSNVLVFAFCTWLGAWNLRRAQRLPRV
jgi:putative Mn2+ efflux pump MntP